MDSLETLLTGLVGGIGIMIFLIVPVGFTSSSAAGSSSTANGPSSSSERCWWWVPRSSALASTPFPDTTLPRGSINAPRNKLGRSLAIGAYDVPRDKGERFVWIVTAALAVRNVGIAFVGWVPSRTAMVTSSAAT